VADDILQLFAYDHLPAHLQAQSKPFHDLAARLATGPNNFMRDHALLKLLEAKDCAVRAALIPDADGLDTLLCIVIPESGVYQADKSIYDWTIHRVTGDLAGVHWSFFTGSKVGLRVNTAGYLETQEHRQMPCFMGSGIQWGLTGPPGARVTLRGTSADPGGVLSIT